jgi:hypothetical protein
MISLGLTDASGVGSKIRSIDAGNSNSRFGFSKRKVPDIISC